MTLAENTFADVQEPVVAASESSGAGSNAAESLPDVVAPEGSVNTESAAGAASPRQTREDNSIAKNLRLESEQARREATQLRRERDMLAQSLKSRGFVGTPAEMADQLIAAGTDRPVEEVRAERERRELEQAAQTNRDAELNDLRTFRRNAIIQEDIRSIKAAYPDCAAETPEELGDEFMSIMATGVVDAVTAYELIDTRRRKSEHKAPPPLPSANSNTAAEKEYYTSEEVDRLSDTELDNPTIRERIRRSMEKWGRKS